MLATANDVHLGVIIGASIGCVGLVGGAVARLTAMVKGWRNETARAVGEVAGLVGDWADEVDDHLADQDRAQAIVNVRLARLEAQAGLPGWPAMAPSRRRRMPRRIEAAERGLDTPQRPLRGLAADLRLTDGEGEGLPSV